MKVWAVFAIGVLTGCATLEPILPGSSAVTRPSPVTDEARAMNHYLAFLLYQRTNQPVKALEELRSAADLSPESGWLQERLLAAYYQREDYENAAVMAKRAIEHDPENILLHIWLGLSYVPPCAGMEIGEDGLRLLVEIQDVIMKHG